MDKKKLVYTSQEAADALVVSSKTITRMVNDGRLPRVQGMRQIRIPVVAFEQWVLDNSGYNPDGAGSDMRNPKGSRKCLSARNERESTNVSVASSGGVPTLTQAVKELDVLLEQPANGRR